MKDNDFSRMVSRTLVSEGYNFKPAYYNSPGGDRLVFIGNRTGYSNIYMTEVIPSVPPPPKSRKDSLKTLIKGDRTSDFETFHLFASKIDVHPDGRLVFSAKSGETDALYIFDIIGEDIAYEKESRDYYDLVVQEALSKVENFEKKYDAILVDEGQDFSTEMFKVVTALLNPKTDNLSIALDDTQNIYRDRISWKDAGIRSEGHVHKLSCSYRNTREIAEFAANFIGKNYGEFAPKDKFSSGNGKTVRIIRIKENYYYMLNGNFCQVLLI